MDGGKGMQIVGIETASEEETAERRPYGLTSELNSSSNIGCGGAMQLVPCLTPHRRKMFSACEDRYEIDKLVGEDSTAWARHKETGDSVLLRYVRDATAGADLARVLVRELRMMRHFRGHDNVDRIREIVEAPQGRGAFKDIYIVTEQGTSLDRVMARQPLTVDEVLSISYQTLRGLRYIHSADVVHGDLKPSILMITAGGQLRITSLGRVRLSADDHFNTFYGVVKMYWAPEVLMGARQYRKSIDAWSFGCVLAEMITGKKLFDSNHPVTTIKQHLHITGFPETADQHHLPPAARVRLKEFAQAMRVQAPPRADWRQVFPQVVGSASSQERES